MAWIYLLIASVFEIAWTFSLKFLDFKKIGAIRWPAFFSSQNLLVLMPLLGYIVFGLANVFFFSLSVKQIPTSTALAVWMGVALIGVKLVDVMLFKEPWQPTQLIYLGLIVAGIVGLKRGV
ncbi:MAG TPA: SMR family transporter [Chitinophaga sp.]|uniref:DMT family transporter n=1 Tax=Chitinophaga sp. TaxID=1869181 RepID=UPI002F95C177